MRCKYCNSSKGLDYVNMLVGTGTYTEWKCRQCNIVVKREYDNPKITGIGFRRIRELLKEKNENTKSKVNIL